MSADLATQSIHSRHCRSGFLFKNGIASLSQLYSTLWLTGAKTAFPAKTLKNNAPNVAAEEATDNTGRFIIDMTQAMS